MKAIVLSGGGAKGAYQIGVWKALKKLHIKYDIITGTSVGALNGVFMVQNDYYKCKKLWNQVDMKLLFENNIEDSDKKSELIKNYGKNFIKNNGTEPLGLEKLLTKIVNKRKFFKSKINFGLISYNITTKKPVIITKEELNKNNIIDYLIASASCYPAFTPKEINNEKLIDGGYYDNLPINLALKLGADEIIAVDLDAPGIKRKTKTNKKITYITPNNKLSFFLKFDKKQAKKDQQLGYNDTLKVFNILEGKNYTFKKNTITKLRKKHKKIYINNVNKILNTKKIINLINENTLLKKIKTEKNKHTFFLKLTEMLMNELKLPEEKIYSERKLKLSLINKIKNTKKENKVINIYKHILKNDESNIKKEAITSPINTLKAIYLYTLIGEQNDK